MPYFPFWSLLSLVRKMCRCNLSTQRRFCVLLRFLGIGDATTSPADCFGPLHEFCQSFLEEKHRYDADAAACPGKKEMHSVIE